MNAVFQVTIEESPEARKFSKDLRALVFCAAKNVFEVAKKRPGWTGLSVVCGSTQTERMEMIALSSFAQYRFHGAQSDQF